MEDEQKALLLNLNGGDSVRAPGIFIAKGCLHAPACSFILTYLGVLGKVVKLGDAVTTTNNSSAKAKR